MLERHTSSHDQMDILSEDSRSEFETKSNQTTDDNGRIDDRIDERPAGNCYCGKDRNLNILELLCATCYRWFHESCIGFQMGKLIPFATNYIFFCKNCSPTGLESFRKCQATISQMCVTAIANLQQQAQKKGKIKYMFDKDVEIIPYMEQYWESMTTMPRRVTQSWYSTVQKTLLKDNAVFTFEDGLESQMFGLVTNDLTQIKPNYEAMVKGGTLRITDEGYAQASLTKGRPNKRKLPGSDQGPAGKKGRPSSDITANVKLPAHGYPLEHPFNKDGYRYILAEPDPHAPFRQEFDESTDFAGRPIPGWLYRSLTPNSVLLALHDRAPQLKVAEDRLAVTGDKGYCMIRASHFVTRGKWYFEVTLEEMPEGSATRIGWGQEYANLQAPLGYDKFGYSWRSRKGTKFHESHGKRFSPGYGEGDTLGFLICLPETGPNMDYMPSTFKDRPLVKFKSHLYYEDKDKIPEAVPTVTGSKIILFKNGESQGVAFENINGGAYYPAISIYKNATVSVNFGPSFKYPEIGRRFKCKGMSDRVEELICEQSLADMVYFAEKDGKLRLDTINS